MPQGHQSVHPPSIETFRSRSRLDLLPLWRRRDADVAGDRALADPWGRLHRPDWHRRGLLIWPRGGVELTLVLALACPPSWRQGGLCRARLALRWWAIEAVLRVNGKPVHQGDLYDSSCRWPLPESWWQGEPLELELELRSPLHDDGALILSRIELEPLGAADPDGLLTATALELEQLRQSAPVGPPQPMAPDAGFHVLSHAHLDLAWLWPVADSWLAAERTFRSALALMQRHPQLHFGHSTPALYAWLERHRPALFGEIRAMMRSGRWEPLNGPWVESDCVLISTASLLRQFQEGQDYSRRTFPEWSHALAWLPDSFGFAAGLPSLAAATGVRWFCTHKLAWNATNPFPHRLFRWRGRCGAEVLTLMTGPIGSDGDPVAMERHRLEWELATGLATVLWLPGVGDHGGGPTAEMLAQLELWQDQPTTAPQQHGSLRAHLAQLEEHRDQLPVWRDELYLELHRGCATSRPDQKRHNRSLERLLREADLATGLLWADSEPSPEPSPEPSSDPTGNQDGNQDGRVDWRPLLFQQFHDILPGTSIADVFEQAEPEWRRARRQARRQRDRALQAWLPGGSGTGSEEQSNNWWLIGLQPLPAAPLTVRLPAGPWWQGPQRLPEQQAPGGGQWVQLAGSPGAAALALRRRRSPVNPLPPLAIDGPVQLKRRDAENGAGWLLGNGRILAQLGPTGLEQLQGADGLPQLSAPLAWCRWGDRGEFWDAWDLAGDHRDHPLPLSWEPGPELAEQGPLCSRLVWRGQAGASRLRLDIQLRAGSPWLELTLSVDWRQRHELLRLELPLGQRARRWAADTAGGVLERPAEVCTAREASRWEVPAISWVASQAASSGLAVLLDGPQGVSAGPDRLGVSLLRGPCWPDPGADGGLQRLRLALLPCAGGWRQAAVAAEAVRFREPLWRRPGGGGQGSWLPILDLGDSDLRLIGLRPDPEAGVLQLTVQNLSPCRRQLRLSQPWQLLERLATATDQGPDGELGRLGPWQLASWRIRRQSARRDSARPQSS
ncbi:alpha-mannosidase [Synechococcus sp. CS-1325]|uniref:alpha-mannosidase n=1 Tax=Synechococcus sp. CS-1325 TaxID=2847979 RepID=UPI00223C1A80|nr:alpha-mannosidase [Synechococcus sp. CS-1325]MCT0200191.1 alpha-mannosidase [Synechococcus sp. CS-1325]